MGIALGSNFDVQTNLPLDSRAVVADITARDAISSLRRYEGMSVYVIATQKEYTLKGGITNAEWTEAMAQGVTVVNTATDRDAITLISRYEGMLVYVKDSKITYQMTSGALTNDGWTYYYGVTASDDVGEIITSARDLTDPHEGTLPCDGATLYDATLYPTLAAKFWNSTQSKWKFGGTGTYPTGQFRTPNFKGAFIRGADLGAGRDPDAASRTASGTNGVTGDAVGSYQDEAFKSHTHIQDAHNHTQNPHTHSMNQLADTVGTTGAIGTRVNVSFDQYTNATTATNNPTTATNQNTGGSETRPKNIAVNFFVRYKPSTRGPKGDTGNAINVVADDTARLAIPAGDRFDGYLAYVQSTKKNWQLQGGIANANWVEIADVSSNQAITNKDIDGGTASNLSRITLPKAAKTTLDGLTRKQGTLFYDTTTNKPYYDDGTFLKVIGSGSGGSINFISGGDAESGTTGITPYNEGSSASRPSAGTGIAPTGITIGTDSTNPLSGTNSFILSKSAVNARGQGYSWSFTIDRAYQAKVLKIEMDYVVNSGSFVAGSPTTDSDLIVYIIDVDSGKAIEPSSFKLLSKSTTISDRFSATFQTSATSLNYRLCLHVANNTTNTWQIKFDNLAVSPSNYVYGTPITDDAATTFTLSNAGNATVSGTISKLGNKGLFSGTITIGSSLPTGNITLNLPAGHTMTISTGYVNSQISALRGTTTYSASAACASATSVIFGGPNSAVWNATVPATWVAGDTIKFDILVPILGWSSSVQMSDGYDGRVVAASYANSGASTTSISTTYTKITTITSKILDTVESFDSVNNRFRIFTSGNYKISHSIRLEGLAASRVVTTALYKNGSILAEIAESKNTDASVTYNGTMSGDIVVPLIAGDYIEIYGRVDSGTTLVGAYGLSRINIEKLAGNPVISAQEEFSLRYTNASGQSIPNGAATTITGWTQSYASHGAFNPTTGVFTSGIAGRFRLSLSLLMNAASFTSGTVIYASIYKNGSEYSRIAFYPQQTTGINYISLVGSDTVDVISTDTVDIRVGHGEATARSLIASTFYNHLTIEKVK